MYSFLYVLVTAFSFVSSLVRRGHSDEYNLAKNEEPVEKEQTRRERCNPSVISSLMSRLLSGPKSPEKRLCQLSPARRTQVIYDQLSSDSRRMSMWKRMRVALDSTVDLGSVERKT